MDVDVGLGLVLYDEGDPVIRHLLVDENVVGSLHSHWPRVCLDGTASHRLVQQQAGTLQGGD